MRITIPCNDTLHHFENDAMLDFYNKFSANNKKILKKSHKKLKLNKRLFISSKEIENFLCFVFVFV